MKAAEIYEAAELNGIELESSCSSITLREWEAKIENTTKADGKRIRGIIKKHLPDLYKGLGLMFYNPYEANSRKKEGLLVYVHSGIEYFLSIKG